MTGGPDSVRAPEGRNQYAWMMGENQADLFLTYCTNAVLAKKEIPGLQIIQIQDALNVEAEYGLLLIRNASPEARQFAGYILSPEGRKILNSYGFETSAK